MVIGVDPSRNPLTIPTVGSSVFGEGQVLVDSLTRSHLGPHAIGVKTEIGDRQVHIVGQYRLGPGLLADGAVIVSDDMFVRLYKNRKIDRISIGVIRLQPGTDPRRLAAALKQILPSDTRVLTRAEMIDREENYWKEHASIGPVFALGAVLGLVVGVVIVHQVVVTDIANRIREYATLKALGYDGQSLQRIVLDEVLLFAVLGFGIACAMSAGLYAIASNATGLPVTMNFSRSAVVFLLTVGMCWTAGLLATRRLRHADPADLF